MRVIIFYITSFIFIGCTSTKKATMISNKLNGTWVPIKQEIGGTALPKAALESQQLIISDSTYTVIAESIDKGVVRYLENKMDIYGKEGVNAGKHFTAIYKFENGELTVCYDLSGKSYPDAFDTKGKPMFFLSIFKKKN